MKKKLNCLALIFFVMFSFSNCADEVEASKNLQTPIAYAGSDIIVVLPSTSSVLDGSLSNDEDGTIKIFLWEKISGPTTFFISEPASKTTSITNLSLGDYTFRLTVTDNDNLVSVDEVTLRVTNNEMYFHGNMDNVSISTNNGDLLFNGWNELKNHPYIEELELNNIGGIDYAYQEIAVDPTEPSTNVLFASIRDDDPKVNGTSRAQLSLRFKDGVDLQVYHTSHRMYLNPDIAYIQNYSSSVVWFTLVEIWNKHVDAWEGNDAGSARWNLAILKETGTGKSLYWRAESEFMQPERKQIWRHNNKEASVPIGKWFTLDIYMKRGEGDKGKMTIKITPDGESTQVLFDINNTTIYPGHPEIQLKSWQPFKLYLDDTYLDWMRASNKQISAFYNDFKWYKY